MPELTDSGGRRSRVRLAMGVIGILAVGCLCGVIGLRAAGTLYDSGMDALYEQIKVEQLVIDPILEKCEALHGTCRLGEIVRHRKVAVSSENEAYPSEAWCVELRVEYLENGSWHDLFNYVELELHDSRRPDTLGHQYLQAPSAMNFREADPRRCVP